MNNDNSPRAFIRDLLEVIALCELDFEGINLGDAGYNNQRTLISSLFKNTNYNKGQIILRLTVIDSLYSTNAAYSYFSFDEMADRIYALGNDEKSARDYFYSVAKTGDDPKELFSEPYGFQKNLSEGSKQMSLLSKYAYYVVLQDPENCPLGFPIYDRLAKEAYPLVRKLLGEKSYYSMSQSDNVSIKKYIACLTQLREALFDGDELFKTAKTRRGYQQFDILDAYLWRMGKFSDGNLSLLLGKEDYIKFIKNLGLDEATLQGRVNASPSQEKDLTFNQQVLSQLKKMDNPFSGLKEEHYLNALLSHWRVYHSYEDKSPRQGVPFK